MTSNDRTLGQKPTADGDGEELAELVDDAVKALSIGGVFGTDGEVREAVDRLKQLEAGHAEL